MNALTVRIAILLAILVAIATGAFVGVVYVSRTKTTQSAVAVLQNAQSAQLADLAPLGANTTLHGMETEYHAQPDEPGMPNTTIGESFWTFDAAGKLSAYSSVVKGMDGHIYQRSDLVNGALVTSAMGRTQTYQNFTATPDSLRAVESRVLTNLLRQITPSVMAKMATVNGVAVFVIDSPDGHGGTNRDYLRQNDYWPLRTRNIAPDGHTTSDTTQTVLEVLHNGPTIAVGTPSLVGGKVNVPITASGAVPNAYSGVNIHLRWDPAMFSFDSISTTGSALPPGFCMWSTTRDTDGGGVVLGCRSTGRSSLTDTGLLVSVVLTPRKTGCSALHLFTLAGADGGTSSTGTYTLNAADAHPQYNPYQDAKASTSGGPC